MLNGFVRSISGDSQEKQFMFFIVYIEFMLLKICVFSFPGMLMRAKSLLRTSLPAIDSSDEINPEKKFEYNILMVENPRKLNIDMYVN